MQAAVHVVTWLGEPHTLRAQVAQLIGQTIMHHHDYAWPSPCLQGLGDREAPEGGHDQLGELRSLRAQVAELSGRNAELGDDLGSALDMAQNAMQERGALQKQMEVLQGRLEALQAQSEESGSQVGVAGALQGMTPARQVQSVNVSAA